MLSKTLLGVRKSSLANVRDVTRGGIADDLGKLGVMADEFWPKPFEKAEEVGRDKHLTVAARAGADADRGNREAWR